MNRDVADGLRRPEQIRDDRFNEASKRGHRLRARILVVDDNADTLMLLRLFFESEGFEVVAADSAIAARHAVQELPPDLVITDFRMPGMTGLELCEAIRAEPRTSHVPIILHTATILREQGASLYDALAPKPVELQRLRQQVSRLLH